MVAFNLSALALLLLQLGSIFAEEPADAKIEEEATEPSTSPDLKLSASVSFPQSEIFGVKLINGHATQALISFTNSEPEAVTVAAVGGTLISNAFASGPVAVANLTTQRYGVEVPAGESESITYAFKTDLHPQDLRLQLTAVVLDKGNAVYTLGVYNETVSVVEAPTSFFDPQIIFLYLVLLGAFTGTLYFVYTTWISTLFPQKKRGGKGGDRAKRSSAGTKPVDPSDQAAVLGADGPAVTSGAKAYDESWLPAHHLQRPDAKRVGSGRSSGGVATLKTKAKA